MQVYSAVSIADGILLETLIDQDGKRSHRAVTEAERIPADEGSFLFQYMNQMYQGVLNYVSFDVDTRFCEDTKRGYVGYKTVAKVELSSNTFIPHLKGIVANCPGHVAENPELNYPIFVKDGCSYSMQGPISLVNHECEPNCSYEVQNGKKGVVFLRIHVNFKKGSEITVKYGGKSFLEPIWNFACVVTASITHQSR